MAKQKGRDVLVKMDIAGTFTTIAGGRQTSGKLSDGNTDVSSNDSPGRWREMLAGTGVLSHAISLAGVFADSAAEAALVTNKLAAATPDFQFIVPGLGTFEGPYVIGEIEHAGNYDGEVTYSVSFESAGELTFTAA
ncbi:MAG: phage major tail protein, TP901-1 family [Hyphomonadaceae bacterium]|nr:phage major tail protein, TP901-1 family [Hyphomonadaceae bacterium]